MKGKTNQ